MEAEPRDGYSVSIPLLLDNDEKQYKLGSVDHHPCTGHSSFFNTCFNGLNALSGVGILTIPYALSSGGWLSLLLLFIIATVTFYTGLLITRCMDLHPNIRSYPDIGEVAFGNKGRIVVSVFMNMELYLVSTGFLILEGDNLQNLLPDVGFEVAGLKVGGKQTFIMIAGLIVVPTVWLNNMNVLSYISASGVLASIIILGSILWAGMYDGIGFQQKGTLLNWNGIPTAVLFLCFLLCTITYASMAIFGYLMFGSGVQSQITLDLPTEKFSSKVAIYTTLVNPLAKYALMVTPIVNAIENRFRSTYSKKPISLLIRATLVISTVIVALAIPFFGSLMSLVGSFLSVTASILLPCLCYLKISGTYRSLGFESVIIGFIVLVGIAIVIVGTYSALVDLIGHL
ncbi:Vacuolar amino acid transporter like [Actinidia chinensis var. chinensis]|uniref:Vacuolar amino acid transporter like n=1 Tax=Actinidia chinensis var. chinensis TaxID=1590841 RepID=A0A2R6RKC2_ACTCC|nr:Vacuolar amino acid transporter like [Actinidia chinensis var. chinensis]